MTFLGNACNSRDSTLNCGSLFQTRVSGGKFGFRHTHKVITMLRVAQIQKFYKRSYTVILTYLYNAIKKRLDRISFHSHFDKPEVMFYHSTHASNFLNILKNNIYNTISIAVD